VSASRTAALWIADGTVKLRMPEFDEAAVADIKASFCAEWRQYDRTTQVWSFLITQYERVKACVERHFAVALVGEVPGVQLEDGSRELAQLIPDLPADVVRKVYRLLMFEIHPDRGGDPELARRVNDAWAKLP